VTFSLMSTRRKGRTSKIEITRDNIGRVEVFREKDDLKRKQFKDTSKTAPKRRTRERVLQYRTKEKDWKSFVYGYSMITGAQIIHSTRYKNP